MKTCRKCATTDPLVFSASRKTICKTCKNAEDKAYRMANPEKEAARNKKWQQDNPEKAAARSRRYRKANPEKRAASWTRWAKANPGAVNAKDAKRRASKLQRTPVWSETEQIKQLYEHCAFLSESTGEPHEVDHVIPLRGKNVSGLHVSDNLQILPKRIHKYKGNRYACN